MDAVDRASGEASEPEVPSWRELALRARQEGRVYCQQHPEAILSRESLPPVRRLLDSSEYTAYINGSIPGWKEKRAERLQMDDGLCALCDSKATEVHHVTYDRLGVEFMTDLISVCDSCHRYIHSTPRHPLRPNRRYAEHRPRRRKNGRGRRR